MRFSVLAGPRITRASRITLTLAGLVLGALTALLGAVTHAGGIDGGSTGLIVSLLTPAVGALTFVLLGGIGAWGSYAAGALAIHIALIAGVIGRGDLIGDINAQATTFWLYGMPAALIGGASLGLIASALMRPRGGRAGRVETHTETSVGAIDPRDGSRYDV